jgi:hypothetical protein
MPTQPVPKPIIRRRIVNNVMTEDRTTTPVYDARGRAHVTAKDRGVTTARTVWGTKDPRTGQIVLRPTPVVQSPLGREIALQNLWDAFSAARTLANMLMDTMSLQERSGPIGRALRAFQKACRDGQLPL